MKKYYIGDLVKHKRSHRFGVVISDTSPLHGYCYGVHVCYVTWSDTHMTNLLDVQYLSGVP